MLAIATWLWITVLFANFAEAIAEGHGKAQADSLKQSRTTVVAHKLSNPSDRSATAVSATDLQIGDFVIVKAGETIPLDGEVIEGVASVDESAITGESAPVVRESGGDRSSVTGGTRVISDWLIIEVKALPGQTFLDRMIAMVEGAKRQKTPNEIALAILLAALTLIFLLVVATLLPYSVFSVRASGQGSPISMTVLVALFVCLAPTTIGALLSAIGIAGMNRLSQANVIAMSGRAVEAAGDIDVLLLDKTGTITLGNRQATRFIPANGGNDRDLAEAAHLASMADETAEGRSIAVLAKHQHGLRGRELEQIKPHFVPFSAKTRMSGVTLDGTGHQVLGKYAYFGAGIGAFGHVWFLKLLQQRGLNLLYVPVRGATEGLQLLYEGSAHYAYVPVSALISQMREGRVRTIFVTGASRLPEFPDVPTHREVGLTDDYEINAWVGLFAPPNLRADVLKTVHATFTTAVSSAAIGERYRKLSMVQKVSASPGEFKRFVDSRIDDYRQVAEQAKLKIEE